MTFEWKTQRFVMQEDPDDSGWVSEEDWRTKARHLLLLPRDASAERGDATVNCLSVRLSVCLSVCLSVRP